MNHPESDAHSVICVRPVGRHGIQRSFVASYSVGGIRPRRCISLAVLNQYTHAEVGGFNRSSQQCAVRTSVPVRQTLPLEFSNRGSSRAVVERISDRLKFTELVSRQISTLREILPQGPIHVLARPALPWTLRIAEVDTDTRWCRQLSMTRQFPSPIPCHGSA
jgi:hypothetical protein